MTEVQPATFGPGYLWIVRNRSGKKVQMGHCHDKDMAFRAARNWLRYNQNLVYGG